jgi:hypothetical protein
VSEKPDICCRCRYYSDECSISGWCRRHSPVVLCNAGYGIETHWPVVQADNWCGEFEPRQPAEGGD